MRETVSYLQRLDSDHLDLVLEFSSWIIEKDPQTGLEVMH